ncbi:uncharacterized protein SCHCODRAFT_02602164 [Schizophyllum commune H4-8]|uniref:DNA replication regulator Sld3 C-terminal domain-containing protein n=1 Tax=Schizophyllum commune (strain H4-8 / FGSC 9210) TaxID=578458 RepID=D8QD89_SCHCM|nr:uncharacterized protein SCHCODRAFT_02602164 [Schizophyllum commune H4-8]KAI5888820.1 hypothetical protein SCHCODRAFT_02602164 [Schizophyllum commune H4-8]
MTVVNPLRYALSAGDNIAWTATQEKQILKDVPWNDIGQSDEQAGQEDNQVKQKTRGESLDAESFIARTYLQYLWLPESIMPLHGFLHALRRITYASPDDNNTPHPLHALIEPLLLTARSAAHKYHTELTAILAEGGGAGEAEEAMMWFAYEHEKHEAASSGQASGGQQHRSSSQQSNNPEPNEDADAQWQTRWLNRMERREAQIQILLYLFKLSLPPSPSADPIASPAKKHAAAMQQDILLSPRKRRRVEPANDKSASQDKVASVSTPSQTFPRKRRRKSPEPAPLAPEVYLEAFMDKLSMWQLVRGLEDGRPAVDSMPAGLRAKASKGGQVGNGKARQDDERDWMQVFCEDVVEPLFKSTLPELCALLRSKVFPHSPFSDEESEDEGVFGGSQAQRGRSETQRGRSQTYDDDVFAGSQAQRVRSQTYDEDDPFGSQAFDDPFDSYSTRSQTHDDRSDRARSKSRASSFGDRLSSDPDEWQDDEETSLAQEEADRAAGAGVKRKREISREVSMSRILRPGRSARVQGEAAGSRGVTPGSRGLTPGSRGLTPGVSGRSLTPMVEDTRAKEKAKKEKELGSVLTSIMEPEPSAPAPIGTSEMGSITPCPAPSVAEGAEALSTSTTSESAALRITIPSSDSSRRKQWKARPTAIQPPANPSKLSAPLPTRRPRGRPMGSTTKRKDAPIASRKVVSRVNAVASSSAVTLDALDGPQPAWRIISPAPRESGAPDPSASEPLGPSASGPLDPAALPSARRRTDLHKRKAEPVPTDDAPRKRRREGPAATSTASEDGPRWLPPRLGPTRTMPSAQDGLTCAAELRPRIWASNKADLHAVLPELFGTKPTSTPISTMVDYMPVIVLDEERIQVSVDQGSPLCCKLTISRKFSCDGAALPHLAPDGLEMATLPRIPLTPCTERHSEPESMTETIQANDARSSLPSGAEHASEHLTAVPTQLEIQESQGAPEAETVHGLAVPEDPLTEGDELKYPPSMTTKLPIVPLVYASEILTALWHHALSDFQPLDARVLDEVTPGGDLAVAQIENPPCQMEKTSIPEMQLPKYLPPDIAALQEAWIQQYPVLLVASRATLATCWHVLVPEEYAYCFLGLFHLAEMQDKIARGPDGEPFTAVDRGGRTNGSVQWTMTLRWVGGGERFLGNEDLRRPWWVPDQLPTHAPTPTTVDDSSELPSATSTSQQLGPSTTGADDPPSDSMAAMARTWLSYLSPAAMSVFPGDRDPDPSISEDDRGVYPVSFVPREEAAASPDFEPADQKPTYVGYALRLDDVRDPRDTLPLAQPVSVYPSGVQSFMAEAEDGMRIVEVRESRQMPVKELGSAMPSALAEAITSEKDEPTVVDDPMDIYESASRVGTLLATHIFTCNMRSLQSNADQLFLDVQRYADLRRSRVSDNIFRCELSVAPVSSEGGQQTMSNEEKVTTTESLARRLHNHLIDRAYEYTDEETNFPIRRLFCIAGIGAGSRKVRIHSSLAFAA